MNETTLLDWLTSCCDRETDLEMRREYGLMIGYLLTGQISRRTCETARDSHLSRARAWTHVLAVITPMREREPVEVAT